MPHPPEDCPISKFFVHGSDGVVWIDNVLCERKCHSFCDRRIQYDKEMKQKLREAKKKAVDLEESIKKQLLKEM